MNVMGLFSFKKDREISAIHYKLRSYNQFVLDSFHGLRQDMSNQSKWISYLHNNHLLIKDHHDQHKTIINEDINNVKSWINHICDTTKEQQDRLEKLESEISEAFKIYNENIIKLYNHMNAKSGDIDVLRQELLKEIEALKKQGTPGTISKEHTIFSAPEQRLLNFMLNQSDPMTYEQISAKTGHRVNTVRVNMNILKKRGLVEETLLPSGVKLFNVKHKEKVKKVYNIEFV